MGFIVNLQRKKLIGPQTCDNFSGNIPEMVYYYMINL